MPSVEFDLSDYEDDIKFYYCHNNKCLYDELPKEKLKDYLQEMYKNLYIYPESTRKIKTMKEIYNDLSNIIGKE